MTQVTDKIVGGIRNSLAHESGVKHVSGTAIYVDDMPEPQGLLHLYPCLSPHAHAKILNMDLSSVEAAPGVVSVITANDIPGTNDFSHGSLGDDRVFSDKLVEYAGQIMFVVAAYSRVHARDAIEKAKIDYEVLPAILNVDDAKEADLYHMPPRVLQCGDSAAAIAGAKHQLSGRLRNGGQEHFYLETQISMAVPKEDNDVLIYSATQDPTAVQWIVARVLAKPSNTVTVEVRRLGGGFGGKETIATHFSAIAAVAALKTGRPVKIRLDRDDDMKVTGKRHAFECDYRVGFDDTGRIQGIEFDIHGHCGNSEDQSEAVVNRFASHVDNCYFLEHFTATCNYWKTHTVSAVAFRGFGTPQGMLAIERIVDRVARHLGKDPLEVRQRNFYERDGRNTTPYGADLHDNILDRLIPEIVESSQYYERRKQINTFNASSNILKKGLALTPIKFGIGFGIDFLNQGGALVHVYADGSIHLNHGGIEMGQGLHTKVAQVVAHELQVDVDRIRISATTTEKVPNTISTAASSGTDLNAAAALDAARTIKSRMIDFLSEEYGVSKNQIVFLPNRVGVGNQEISFDELASKAFMKRVQLSAVGFYKSPEIQFDFATMTGEPHRYYVYGAAVAEVLVDTLTGENKVTRVDILHDVGKSLNPAVDFGQLEGGFVQGMGWMTTEELVWDDKGVLCTHAPSTYKIPTASDRPDEIRMAFVDWSTNIDDSVFRSKAIGEPPLCLGISVLNAFADAVANTVNKTGFEGLNSPATAENILITLEKYRNN